MLTHETRSSYRIGLRRAEFSPAFNSVNVVSNDPGVDPHARLGRQVVTAFNQRQVVARLQPAAQGRLDLVADDRLRTTTYRLGRAPTVVTGRRYPAVDRGAANHEFLGYHVG